MLKIPDSNSSSCSQCQASTLVCRYQEGGKRGLPAAYMTSLERRLTDTEMALSAALLALQDHAGLAPLEQHLNRNITLSPRRERSKAEKQDEWKRFPLRNSDQLTVWLQAQSQSDAMHVVEGSNRPQSVKRSRSRADGNAAIPPISFAGERQPLVMTEFACDSRPPVQEQLKQCNAPKVPNSPQSPWWYDNYF